MPLRIFLCGCLCNMNFYLISGALLCVCAGVSKILSEHSRIIECIRQIIYDYVNLSMFAFICLYMCIPVYKFICVCCQVDGSVSMYAGR